MDTTPIIPPMLLLDTLVRRGHMVTEVVSHPLPSTKLLRHQPFTIDLLDTEIAWAEPGVWFFVGSQYNYNLWLVN